jgi:adhesin transport system membrane fusion protein
MSPKARSCAPVTRSSLWREVKEAYLDPRAFERLAQQVEAKRDAVTGKRAKADALARQRVALDSAWVFARQKGDNRIAQLTASLAAAQLEDSIATVQASRAQALFAEGLRSRGELETARQRAQRASALALEVAAALATARADRAGVEADYSEKIAKVEGDRSSALAEAAEGGGRGGEALDGAGQSRGAARAPRRACAQRWRGGARLARRRG